MHNAAATRVGSLSKEEQAHYSLPVDTHIINGTLEADGPGELASAEAKLSARVLKTVRTASGGIEYQLAIYASEPVPVAPEGAQTPEEQAVAYLLARGVAKNPEDASAMVAKYGAASILARREKDASDAKAAQEAELDKAFKSAKPPKAPKPQLVPKAKAAAKAAPAAAAVAAPAPPAKK